MDLAEQHERLRALVTEMTTLTTQPDDYDGDESWDMPEKAAKRFDECETEAAKLRTTIANDERRRDAIAQSTAILGGDDAANNRGAFDPPNVNRNGDPYDLSTLRIDTPMGDLRARIETGLERDKITPDSAKEGAMRTLSKVQATPPARARVAHLFLATGSDEYRAAFTAALHDPQMLPDSDRALLARAQSLTDAAGGFAVPFTLDPTIIGTDGLSINPFRRIARVVQTTTDSWNGVTGTASSFSYDAEATEVSDDSITLAQPSIAVHKMQGFIPFSIEAGMDWASIDSDLRTAMIEGKDNADATAHVTGSGTNEPIGIQTALDGTASEIAPATAETFAAADIYEIQRLLPPRHRMANPRWVMNIGTSNDIRQFDTSGGGNFWADLGSGTPGTMAGWAWEESSVVDDSPDIDGAVTADNFVLYVGNWSRYVIVDRIGMNVELIPHLFDTANNRPSGERGLYAYLRSGADSVDDNAFRVLSIPTTA